MERNKILFSVITAWIEMEKYTTTVVLTRIAFFAE